jgi:hypothetical protein
MLISNEMNKNQIVPTLTLVVSFLIGFFFLPITYDLSVRISSVPKGTLQLQTLKFTTPIPPTPTLPPVAEVPPTIKPPAESCGVEGYPKTLSKEANGKCCVWGGPVARDSECCTGTGRREPQPGIEQYIFCADKPVIYLYPVSKTSVDVEVVTKGTVTVSIPTYPTGGWKNVIAYPDGRLFYQGKQYKNLFYETAQERTAAPKGGVVIKREELEEKLLDITTKLGLIKPEQDEFMEYWTPRLKNLEKPYILASLFTGQKKEELDKINITPKPDVFIEILMYFKGLDQPIDISPLKLPTKPTERYGFTAVEWGGIVDSD